MILLFEFLSQPKYIYSRIFTGKQHLVHTFKQNSKIREKYECRSFQSLYIKTNTF